MQLKNYQQNSLNILKSFFEQCRITGHVEAFKKITSGGDITSRLAGFKNNYTLWEAIPNTPRVCIKVPTGGGKTIIAAYAVKIISQTWCEKEYPFVLWFVPSDTIRRQTAEALKNPRHPYRAALNDQFEGKVRVFDLDEKFNIRPVDVSDNVCIVVSTMQSFVKENTSKYNVYKDNENLEDHFSQMNNGDSAGMEMREQKDRPQYSFANLLYYHRPIMIVDEAHKVVTDLSQETQRRINPAAVIEFTATPRPNNNTLYNVRAAELKEEEMKKLPIALVEHSGWELAVDEAIARRDALEKDAKKEKEYIRPILLFQAQSKDKEVTVEVLKKYLLETANVPENQIKIATGDQKELDAINLFNTNEPTRYIITVEALKEGWDCSFAYVLCSLANIRSDTSVEQLLGRVMRMPYAKSRKTSSLNKAYAYVVSPRFGEAAAALTEKLINKGFDDEEARSTLRQEAPAKPDLDPNWKFENFKRTEPEKSFAEKGLPFSVPRLMVEIQGELFPAGSDEIFERFDWNIGGYAPAQLDKNEFNIEETPGKGFYIDIDGSRLTYSVIGKEQLLPFMTDVDVWTPANLVYWLDRNLKQEDIPQSHMLAWLRRVIEHLTDTRKIAIPNLMIAKYALLNKLLVKIAEARKNARTESFDLFKREYRKEIDFDKGFEFKMGMYDDVPSYYQGTYKFNKHFLGRSKIPSFDGNEKGEEFLCAQAIDAEPQIAYWLRNAAKHPASFRLPVLNYNFYPDFIAKLHDGRILVIEYKGEHIIDSQDTKEKAFIGEIWEKLSKGRNLFLLAVRNKDGKTVAEQIQEKIHGK